MTLRFLLVCEGSADAELVQHIRRLLVNLGQEDPQGTHWYYGRLLADKIRGGLQNSGACDLLLVHRDSDSPNDTQSAGPGRRREEISAAISDAGYDGAWASIVPVRMTETWLLLDEAAIRAVVGRPNGNDLVILPPSNNLESVANPKDVLDDALLSASGASGRRLSKIKRDLPKFHRRLLEDLPVGGPLEQIPSWVRFRDDLREALAGISDG